MTQRRFLGRAGGRRAIHLATDTAELVVTTDDGRSYFDLGELEPEAEALLRHRVNVTHVVAHREAPERPDGTGLAPRARDV
ncbi:MAG: hypothetical protein M0Z40_05235 [Actinomycetota bacterium]|nr:hypothetical protein [Actinomycetota bacterium]MDA8074629.1 hypothetical protein [Actinomycetota bacterium]